MSQYYDLQAVILRLRGSRNITTSRESQYYDFNEVAILLLPESRNITTSIKAQYRDFTAKSRYYDFKERNILQAVANIAT